MVRFDNLSEKPRQPGKADGADLPSKTPCPPRQWLYLGLAVGPVLALMALLGFSVISESKAKRQLDVLTTQTRRHGVPLGNASTALDFDRRTDQTRAVRWQNVVHAAMALENTYWIPMVSDKWEDWEQVVPPEVDWKMAPALKKYSRHASPIVAELRDVLDGSDEPIWSPILFADFETLLPGIQNSRIVARMLAYDFRAAYHAGNHQQAIESLGLIPGAAGAVDYQNFLVVDLVHISLLGMHRLLIRESLNHEYWTIEDIERLRKQLAPIANVNERWNRSMTSELAMMLEAIGIDGQAPRMVGVTQVTPMPISPVHQLAVLQRIEHFKTVPVNLDSGESSGVGLSEEAMRAYRSSVSLTSIPFATMEPWAALLTPAYDSYISAYARLLRERRWTLCALAIKEFQLRFERWPTSLDGLTRVGLSRPDWSVTANTPFGYRVAKDGSHVLLWTLSPVNSTMESEPPSTLEEHRDGNYLDQMQVRIE